MKELDPDTSYVFRVRAQNLTGVGKPSATLGPVLARTRTGECRLNTRAEKESPTEDSEVCFVMHQHSVTMAPRVGPFLRHQRDLHGRGR